MEAPKTASTYRSYKERSHKQELGPMICLMLGVKKERSCLLAQWLPVVAW